MALTTVNAAATKPVNVIFQQQFLRRAQQVCPYFIGSQPGRITRGNGADVCTWRRWEQETPTITPLTPVSTAQYMQGRSADTPTLTDTSATMAKYGQFYVVNEEVDLYQPNGTAMEFVDILAESAGRSLNMLQRDILEENSTQRYAANVASDGAVHAAVVVGDLDRTLNELARADARTFMPMTDGSRNIGTAPILPAYWGFCHPDVAYNISKLSGFKSVETYAGQTATITGEFGLYAGAGYAVRFIQSSDASIDLGDGAPLSGADLRTGASTEVDLYTIVILGQNAHGSVGLGQRHTDGVYRAGENRDSFELIFHAAGSGGTSDPFNEIRTLAWKAFWTGAILNSNWSRSIRVGATNLSN